MEKIPKAQNYFVLLNILAYVHLQTKIKQDLSYIYITSLSHTQYVYYYFLAQSVVYICFLIIFRSEFTRVGFMNFYYLK